MHEFNCNLTSILLLVNAGFPCPLGKEHLTLEAEVLSLRSFVIYSCLSATNGTKKDCFFEWVGLNSYHTTSLSIILREPWV